MAGRAWRFIVKIRRRRTPSGSSFGPFLGLCSKMLGGGLEPPRLAAYAPQTYVSAISPPERLTSNFSSDSVCVKLRFAPFFFLHKCRCGDFDPSCDRAKNFDRNSRRCADFVRQPRQQE